MDFAIIMDPQRAGTPQGLNSFYWGGAFGTWFWIDPTNDLVFVGMIQNQNGSNAHRRHAADARDLAAPHLRGADRAGEVAVRARLALLLAGLAAACAPAREPAPAFDTTLTTQQLMKHVIDPAAVALWDRAGELQTSDGVVNLAPDTPEEWAAAESEAAIVAEAGNLLILPQRVRILQGKDGRPDAADGGDWTRFSLEMTRRALAVKAATTARDTEKMFDTGGELYQACVACHDKYYVPFLKEGQVTNAPR